MFNQVRGKDAYNKRISENYERDRVVEPIWEIENNWLEEFLSTINESSRILDLPVGTGRFFEIYEKYNLQKVFGCDISMHMLNQAIKKNAHLKLKVELSTGNCEDLNFEDNFFDYIICFRLFHLLSINSIDKTIAEFKRINKNKIIIEVFNSSFDTNNQANKIQKVINFFRSVFNFKKSPWSHIKNYFYSEKQLIEIFHKHELKVENKYLIGEGTSSPATIYILC